MSDNNSFSAHFWFLKMGLTRAKAGFGQFVLMVGDEDFDKILDILVNLWPNAHFLPTFKIAKWAKKYFLSDNNSCEKLVKMG